MAISPQNFVTTTIRAPVGLSDTQLQLAAGTGYLFNSISAGNYAYVTVNDSTTVEIMRYISSGPVVNDTITIIRAQDGTTAKAFPAGACVAIFWNVAQVRDYVTQIVLSLFGTVALPTNTMLTSGIPIGPPPINIIYAVDPNTGELWFYNGGTGTWLYINSNSTQLFTTAPTVAPAGNIRWTINTVTSTLYYWTGVTWLTVAGGGAGGPNFLEINTREYLDPTGIGLAKDADYGVEVLIAGGMPFVNQCVYKSNSAISNTIVIPSSGIYLNQVQLPVNCIVELTGSFVGDKSDATKDVHAALSIIHANDTFEWQGNFMIPGDTNNVITDVSGTVSTDPYQVTGPDYFNMVLTIYDNGATYAGFVLKKLSFGVKVIALL